METKVGSEDNGDVTQLIQTEFHHVRTLRIMEGVYRRGMLEEVMLEAAVVHTIFPCLDQLLEWHSNFLSHLLNRRREGLVGGSTTNFTIRSIGDLLLTQFSGQSADDMKKLYSEFCSRHPKAVKLYKEVLTRDRRLQQFVRRACRGPLLRRHGVQECILLVTQRLTKYPVLIQRILDNTKGNSPYTQEVRQRLVSLSTQLHALQAAVIRQDSILELSFTTGPAPSPPEVPAPGPRLSRSLSRDAGMDAGGEALLLRRQVALLQQEVTRLRLRGEDPTRDGADPVTKRRGNGEISDVIKGEQQVNRRRGSRELESRPLAPLASQDPVDQLDGVQEGNEEEEVTRISPRSDSPRDLQDIPEESES
ncbi:rho guanine nucleotide exchange factor 2-like [Etheostoma cragini]|uniref:rho guanine nucleotide exchange factor 2-like n=1 Tax=Etheostoma cragini TaxID=417921 RepID=UPI00155EC002|nr:rho guanine nucleotide exchange factor 2-like [Etheostoma cragini]